MNENKFYVCNKQMFQGGKTSLFANLNLFKTLATRKKSIWNSQIILNWE